MNKFVLITFVLVSTALMGSSFSVGKIGLQYISPLLMVGVRFVMAGILMVIYVRITRKPLPKDFSTWMKVFLIGLFQTAGVFAAIFISLRTITAGQSAILTFMNPLLVVIFGSLILGMKYHLVQWGGVILGFVGVMITLGGQFDFQFGTILGFGGAISWAIATLLVNRWGKSLNTWVLSAYQMLFGGLVLLLCSLLFEKVQLVLNPTSVFVILWLAIMASVVQFTMWFFVLQQGNPAKVSSFLFLAPFFGVLTGWLLLHETIGPTVIVGGLCIFGGIFLVNWTAKVKT
ncbi:DMT family transporter [Sporosarcina sp. BI001-red]|uniref:DMT family transporter n=1 Tax=Sporosarcina sp. BI001-red TaxID=2282866 RepID=UPI000E24F056|nr:DMT family transporter [Sporosarcina sp. BI001-red]REB05497.1 DMT family transporter [Sporosarcina sp. BI001-red]